jgi:hypothetical protein
MTAHRVLLAVGSTAALLAASSVARAQPSATDVLSSAGFSASDIQSALAGGMVSGTGTTVSDTDLSVTMAFLVKAPPDDLSRRIFAGALVDTDPQVREHGAFQDPPTLADLAALQLSSATAQTLLAAQAGEKVNLSGSEIAAFNALQSAADPTQAARAQLQQMLLARHQAYRTGGLGGIAPYARGGGTQTDVAGALRKASAAVPFLTTYVPAFQAVLVGYPQTTLAGMREVFSWVDYDIQGTATYALTHTLGAADGAARVLVQRQYYVSTGYNAEQAVAVLLPVQEGTLVAYFNHTFTDQIAGFGGAMKRQIGQRLMADKLKELFEEQRTRLAE